MRDILAATALGLLTLSITTGPVGAQAGPDPMRAARGGATPVATDPMQALRAQAAASPDAGPAANDEFGGLPDAPGAEETYYQCVACHSTEIIKQQRLTDARWDDLWQWMIDQQGMVEPDPETKDIVLGYLKTHFSAATTP